MLVDASVDGCRLSDWISSSGISRSTAYELLKLLQIEPEQRRVPGVRKLVSFINSEQQQQIEALAQALREGSTMPQLRERLGSSNTVSAIVPIPSQTIQQAGSEASQIVPINPDPLKPWRQLAEVARCRYVLDSATIAAILGLSKSTIASWENNTERLGFRFERVSKGQWRIRRMVVEQ
jgi:predicted DNA-binding transcriptional regulator AlpA